MGLLTSVLIVVFVFVESKRDDVYFSDSRRCVNDVNKFVEIKSSSDF